MDFIQSVILGLVQGLTEFLPVSSSGHLAVVESLMGITDIPVFFDVMLHVGTLVAVFIALWHEIAEIIAHPVRNKFLMLVIATLPAIAMTLIAENVFPEVFSDLLNGKYLAFGFYGTTVVLCVSETIARRVQKKRTIRLPEALVMGAMQAAAIAPGLSRSGSTISGGLFTGVPREQAAKFAFLMSIPAILGGVVYGAKDVAENGMGSVEIPVMLVGLAVAAVSGFLAIKWMLNLITHHKLYGFAVYTAVLGTAVLMESLLYGTYFPNPFV